MHLCCSLFQVWSPYWNVQKCIIMGFLIRSKNVRSRTPILKGSKYILYQLYDTNRQTLWVSIWLRFKKRFSLYYYWFVFFKLEVLLSKHIQQLNKNVVILLDISKENIMINIKKPDQNSFSWRLQMLCKNNRLRI